MTPDRRQSIAYAERVDCGLLVVFVDGTSGVLSDQFLREAVEAEALPLTSLIFDLERLGPGSL